MEERRHSGTESLPLMLKGWKDENNSKGNCCYQRGRRQQTEKGIPDARRRGERD